ncbi:MAG TPA: DUF3857 domain-containing protein [Kofleriaceae bacterium]|nr:DUF3857 domain-containing protein [Kofleriaceae bacterium]
MNRVGRWASVGAIALALAGRAGADPLDKPSFTATPAEMLAAGKTAHGEGVVVLRTDESIAIDDRGLVTRRWREVFVVRDKDDADDWSVLGTTWEPWHDNKPQVRLRVIDPSGRVEEPDPARTSDAPSAHGASRRLDVQLPVMAVDAVVEEEITLTEHTPIVGAGGSAVFFAGDSAPRSTRITLSAPAKRALHVERGMPAGVRAKHDTAAGRETWSYTLGPLDEPTWEPNVPPDVYQRPYVGITTVGSWPQLARDLGKTIDAQIAAHPLALPADVPARPSLETARAALAWLHHGVKYDGVELDASAFTPAGPAEVVQRGSGNAIELATALVALLRQTGARADVVLVREGPGFDVDAELPTIESFDRALVRAKLEGADVYIDPSNDLLRLGQLPAGIQGRRALVVADDTTGLTATPAAKPADNFVREVRTIELSEHGDARVTEVSREGGVFEATRRAAFRDSSPATLHKNLESYVKDHYLSDELDSYTTSPVDDLATPFELTIVANHSKRATTEREQAGAHIFPAATFEELPPTIAPASNDTKVAPRKHDYLFSVPQVCEIENRIVFPAGFDVPAAAPVQTRALGTLELVETQRVEGQTLVVTYRLDTGKLRLTPAEVEQARTALRDMRKESKHVKVEPAAWSLVEKGKYREAVAEARRVAAAHPRDAIYQSRLADVLLEAGAGAAARRAARKAVELAPKSADAHVVLGYILEHDTLGREFAFDFDRAGARAELEKARALDPKYYGAAYELGRLLERGSNGVRFDRGADLKAAAAAWRAAYELDGDAQLGLELARTLVHAGSGADAVKVTQALDRSDDRDALLVAATDLAETVDAARRVAADLEVGQRRMKLLAAAGGVLVQARRYGDGRALLVDGAYLGSGNDDRDKLFARLAVSTPPKLPTKDPVDVARAALAALFDPEEPKAMFWDDETADEFYDLVRDEAKTTSLRGLPTQILNDIELSSFETQLDGDPGHWRVVATANDKHTVFYVALDHGSAKIIGTAEAPQGVGRYVQKLLAHGDDKLAARYLDWLAKDVIVRPSNKDVYKRAFTAYWVTGVPRDPRALELGALFLAGDHVDVVPSTAIGGTCSTLPTPTKLACGMMMLEIYAHKSHWNELLDFGKDWAAQLPKPLENFTVLTDVHALLQLGKPDDAEREVAAALARAPDDTMVLIAALELEARRHHYDVAIAHGDAMLKHPDAGAIHQNLVAWLKAIAHVDLPGALASARQATRDKEHEAAALNTVAVVELESGDLKAAKADEYKAIEAAQTPAPPDSAWYLFGRLYEQLGLPDDAIAAYRRLPPPKETEPLPTSYELARERLKALGAAPK